MTLTGVNIPFGEALAFSVRGNIATGKLDKVLRQRYQVTAKSMGQAMGSLTFDHTVCGKDPSDMRLAVTPQKKVLQP